VQHTMENAYPLAVPLLTEARWGANWGNLTVFTTEPDKPGAESTGG
jgi:hypothetical protein